MFRLLLIAATVLGASARVHAQDATVPSPSAPVQKEQASDESKSTYDLLKSFYRHEATLYQFTLDEAGKEKLKLEPTAMTWTGDDYKYSHGTVAPVSGEVYVWTYEGRAMVAGGVGSFPRADGRVVFHEFYCLTERAPREMPIHATEPFVWRPIGVKPQPIPDAPAPTDLSSPKLTASRRLLQMRRMAEDFQGRTMKADGSGEARLRLIPAPIYRTDPEELKGAHHNIVDGAIFVLTGEVGTDAEMLINIECRKTAAGLEWTYIPASMTYLEMWLEHKDKEVWHMPNYLVDQREHNYFSSLVEGPLSLDEIRKRIEPQETKETPSVP
jgi:hypothetical protein